MRLWGRQPALWISAIGGVLMMLSQFGVHGIDAGLAATVQLLLTAIVTAWTALHVRPVAPTVFAGVITAAAELAMRFGAHLTEAQIASFTTVVALFVTAVVGWPNQTPRADPAPGFPVR